MSQNTQAGRPFPRTLVVVIVTSLVTIALTSWAEFVLSPRFGEAGRATDIAYHAGFIRGVVAGLSIAQVVFMLDMVVRRRRSGAS